MVDAVTSLYEPECLGSSAILVRVSHSGSQEREERFWMGWVASNLGRVCILGGDPESSPRPGNGTGLTKHKRAETIKGEQEAAQVGRAGWALVKRGVTVFRNHFLCTMDVWSVLYGEHCQRCAPEDKCLV